MSGRDRRPVEQRVARGRVTIRSSVPWARGVTEIRWAVEERSFRRAARAGPVEAPATVLSAPVLRRLVGRLLPGVGSMLAGYALERLGDRMTTRSASPASGRPGLRRVVDAQARLRPAPPLPRARG